MILTADTSACFVLALSMCRRPIDPFGFKETPYGASSSLYLQHMRAPWLLAFDPLMHFKGPFIAPFADAYAGYHAVRRRLHLQTLSDL
ncbi:hypothetical protein GGR52DRAFT_510076 [Hypoxylon sp. FL1284]|nr:hypothetical protein GGR52DRAFT_510076 [Hypoxylon sp. FL1284]